MKCQKCSHYVPEDSDFCQYCGVKLENVPDRADVKVHYNENLEESMITNSLSQNSDEKCKKASVGTIAGRKRNNRIYYCKLCGCAIDSSTKKCTVCGKQYLKIKFRPLYVFIIIIVMLIGYLGINYFLAISAMNKQEFIKAQQLYDNLVLSKTLFPDKYSYVQAGVLMEQGLYLEALRAFNKMSDIPAPGSLINSLKSKVYSEGQKAYRAGRLEEAKDCFYVVGNSYKRSSDYIVLIRWKSSTDSNSVYYDEVIKILDFEDASETILEKQDSAIKFLTGRWENSTNYFEIEKWTSNSSYNLPEKNVYGYYNIKDGVYSVNSTKFFKFTIIDGDTISVYCYKDGSTHKLYRQ